MRGVSIYICYGDVPGAYASDVTAKHDGSIVLTIDDRALTALPKRQRHLAHRQILITELAKIGRRLAHREV